ncbi:MAG: glycosyltransferase family 4 protein [Thermodesulfobacteriota bacterium]
MRYPLAEGEKYCLWMGMPDHHTLDFMRAMYDRGIDLKVRFFDRVSGYRIGMGWKAEPKLHENEALVQADMSALRLVPDWRDRIHIVPGTVGDRFLMALVDELIRCKVEWVHWSECVKPGLNRILRIPIRKRYGQKIQKYAIGALAISKMAEREFMRWGLSGEKIKWLPYSANPLQHHGQKDDQIASFCGGRFVFMFCGALCHRKGVDVLLSSFAAIARRYGDTVLVLVGPDMENGKYQAQTRHEGIIQHVLFRGVVKAESIGRLLSMCDVFILPSRYDGWGMVLFEAASLGKAVIATDRCGAAHHLIMEGVNGFKVKAGDSISLQNAMERYVSSPEMAIDHGKNSARISEFFSPGNNVERFLDAMQVFLRLKRLRESM